MFFLFYLCCLSIFWLLTAVYAFPPPHLSAAFHTEMRAEYRTGRAPSMTGSASAVP